MANMTQIQCGECGGAFYAGRDINTGREIFAMCDDCGHEVTAADITPNLEPGEVLTFDARGRLSYVTTEA